MPHSSTHCTPCPAHPFQERTGYRGELKPALEELCRAYSLGALKGVEPILFGYEDCNLALNTSAGKYFVKLFASFRGMQGSQRCIKVAEAVLAAGVNHPRLYYSPQGALFHYQSGEGELNACVMEFVCGRSFFESHCKPSASEQEEILAQAAKLQRVNIELPFVYDSWAIPNLCAEFEKHRALYSAEERRHIEPVHLKIRPVLKEPLPAAFTHGDIISPNVLKRPEGGVCIIDFSVANIYPRLVEPAVLFSDLLHETEDPGVFHKLYQRVCAVWEAERSFTSREKELLPLFIRAGHVMHIIGAGRERALRGNNSCENKYWYSRGMAGVEWCNKIWGAV